MVEIDDARETPSTDLRWVSYRGVEVQVPEAWEYDDGGIRPDCADTPDSEWAADVPRTPYVELVGVGRAIPALGCPQPKQPWPDPFGDLIFELWQPHVTLSSAANYLDPAWRDGEWDYEGWRITRATVAGVHIHVLAPPGEPDLGREIVDSARTVDTDVNGCATESPVTAERFETPTGPALAEALEPNGPVGAMAVCQYTRDRPGYDTPAGLVGSRLLGAKDAAGLLMAMVSAPAGGGPDKPDGCAHYMYGDSAVSVHVFDAPEPTPDHLTGEAYVYYAWCFGNGVVDSAGSYRLTRANCAPLFAHPPMQIFDGSAPTLDLCANWRP